MKDDIYISPILEGPNAGCVDVYQGHKKIGTVNPTLGRIWMRELMKAYLGFR